MTKRISFHRSLYLPEAVEAAATAFAEHAQIALSRSADETVAEISGVTDHDPELVANAFSNYVLQETIARMRQATPPEV